MTHETKVTVSAGELAMAADREVILTKRKVIETASALFTILIPAINDIFKHVPVTDKKLFTSIPKISKGENYIGFPYVIMDHPACFEKENIFAVRTMFLWGHFFSITLHISGKYKKNFQENILKNLAEQNSFFISVGEAAWEHHFEENNCRQFSAVQETDLQKIREKSFMKIALKYELHDWNMMQSILPEGYKKLCSLLNIQ